MTALLELEQVTKELDLPLYQEGQSGIVWALKEAKEGSVYTEFIAYLVELVGDEAYKPVIETVVIASGYDLSKRTLSAAFIALPSLLVAKQKEKLNHPKQENTGKESTDRAPNVVDFKTNEKLAAKWKEKQH
ncbi:hypothetical protein [Vibrio campbellii]|uniref:hypothetical protein n=1 Tax=Vibrio campbellii TaxID=680 RepID=UPI0021088B1C|nr:hypothetical protein [Vibrio campbellii]